MGEDGRGIGESTGERLGIHDTSAVLVALKP